MAHKDGIFLDHLWVLHQALWKRNTRNLYSNWNFTKIFGIYFNYIPISPWSQWDFRLCPESWSWMKCFWASPKQWGEGLYWSIELDSHIKTMGKRRREKDPCCKICRQLVILASSEKESWDFMELLVSH